MKILFLTLANVYDIHEHDLYQDLMRCFVEHKHEVYIVTGIEKNKKVQTSFYNSYGCNILRVQVGNQSNCSLIEKGISTIMLKYHYESAINKYLKGIKFDLILYATPPITLMPLIKKLKRKYQCLTYLMLKDIFPQNAVDLGMMKQDSILYHYFRTQEKKLYRISDYIGCMSKANVDYILEHNNLQRNKIEICPNALLPVEPINLSQEEKNILKQKHKIPENKIVFIYGGNLGKPQGISFLIDCLKATKNDKDIFMIIIGFGSEFFKLKVEIEKEKIKNVLLLNKMPRDDYFKIIGLADVGMIFLDYRFTIPNFPSRILSYMENKIPIICVTDKATDIGSIVEKNNFGWKCYSNDINEYLSIIEKVKKSDCEEMGERGRKYLEEVYNTENCYRSIIEKC